MELVELGIEESPAPVQKEIQERCQSILGFNGSGFAGARPVSINSNNVELLCDRPYRVSLKADGTRYMMYISSKGAVYMLNRKNTVFTLPNIRFLSATEVGQALDETLVDGEMVLERNTDGEMEPCYLLFDIMQIEGDNTIAKKSHKTRMNCIQHKVLNPREAAVENGTLDTSKEPFQIKGAPYLDSFEAEKMLNELPAAYGTDGLIFTPAEDHLTCCPMQPYSPGHCGPGNHLLKWKPPHFNTVDFLLRIEKEGNKKVGKLYVGNGTDLLRSPVLCSEDIMDATNKPLAHTYAVLDFKNERNKEAERYNGCIIECNWNEKTGWNFMKARVDKNHPNELTTSQSVVAAIEHPVSKDRLLEIVRSCPKHSQL